MNKKLVALAVAGAFASPLAVQAQTANVTLYGRANIDLEFVNGTTCNAAPTCLPADRVNPTVARLSSNSSRFGLRGTESLGGGLNAIFQVESNVSFDTGNSSSSGLASRETFAGLQGSWGKLTAGKFLVAQDDLHAIFGNAPTLLTSILSTADVWAFGNLNLGQGGFDARPGNNVRYDTPNYMGFTGAVQISLRDDTGNTTQTPNGGDNGDHVSQTRHAYSIGGNLIYANGPFNIGGGFQQNEKIRGPNLNDTDATITGAYDFGTIMAGFGLRIGLVYEYTKYDTPTGSLKRNFGGVSGTIPVGGGKVYLFYGKGSNGRGAAADGETVGYLVHGPDTNVQQWEASYSYNLSPRTLLYAGYVKLVNACHAIYQFNINTYDIARGTIANGQCSGKPGGAVFGFVHLF